MQDVKIYLKSGQVVEFVVEHIRVTVNSQGNITKLTWVNIPGETRLLDVQLDQIAAITYNERDDGEEGRT